MKRNFLYYLSPSLIRGLIGIFIIIPVSTYYLDPEHFGVYAIIAVFSGLVVPLTSIGVGWVLGGNYYRLNSKDKGELIFNVLFLEMFLRTFWVVVFASLGVFFLPKLISVYQENFFRFFLLLLCAEWCNGVYEIGSYIMILQKKAKVHAFVEIAEVISNAVILIGCLWLLNFKTISLIFAYLGAAITKCLFCLWFLKVHMIPKLRIKWLKETVRLGFTAIPLNLFDRVSNSLEKFFIQRWIGVGRLGIYSHSLNYQKMFVKFFKAFSRTFSPEVLEGISKKDNSQINYVKSIVRKWFGLMAIGGAAVVLFSKEAINILTHGKFIDAAPLVSAWFILVLIYSFGVPYTQFLYANKKIKFIFVSDMIVGVFSWVITAILVKFIGITGATIAILLYFFILYTARKIYSLKLGATNFEGAYFWICFAFLLCLMTLSFLGISFMVKIVIFSFIVFFISYYFKLVFYLKKLIKE